MNKTIHTVESAAAGGAFLIEDIYPLVDGGRFPVKRVAGESVEVWADIYRSGDEAVSAALVWRGEADREWRREPMTHFGNDRWRGTFTPPEPGEYVYAVEAWTDEFASWRKTLATRQRSGTDIALDAIEGAALLSKTAGADHETASIILHRCEDFLQTGDVTPLLADELKQAMAASQPRADLTSSPLCPLIADREKARFSTWYQLFPRSQTDSAGRHGTLRDCIARIPDIAAMGFDVLYLTPIHPIGRTRRKGRNNSPIAGPKDPGSPYAIGSADGGHDAIHPELGDIEDLRALVATCREHGMEVALDFVPQCSPDHPWLSEHPEWFKWRPDGSTNSTGYQDVVTPDFACLTRSELWNALRDAMLFWIEQGITLFAIDNHDTAPLNFWEWLIRDIRRRHPEIILFSKTFARAKLMNGLAKLGFAQSFSYFPWRTHKVELQQYFSELAGYPAREFYRPNLFVNTADVLPYHLQTGEPWLFKSRIALAATLSGNCGILGGFELLEHDAVPGREEYLNSDKYEVRLRDWSKPGHIRGYIASLNRIRRENKALQQSANIRFLSLDDPETIAFTKQSVDGANTVLCAIALSRNVREFWLPLEDLLVDADGSRRPAAYIENLSTLDRHAIEWGGVRLRIDPYQDPALLFRCTA